MLGHTSLSAVYTYLHLYTFALSFTHTRTHTRTQTHIYIWYLHIFIYAVYTHGIYISSFIHLRSLFHTHTRTHTRTQTHIYICTYKYPVRGDILNHAWPRGSTDFTLPGGTQLFNIFHPTGRISQKSARLSIYYYGVATISRLLKTIGFFCKRAL